MKPLLFVAFCFLLIVIAKTQKNPYFTAGRSTIVQLFEWKWNDIANECEGFLKDKGYGGVQTSPANENVIVRNNGDRPWWERYQPVSYQLVTRSGNRDEFANMVKRCNNAGIRVYPDVVLNHMTGGDGTGTAGNSASKTDYNFPAVPYTKENFHSPPCTVDDYQNRDNMQKCELVGLSDLDQSQEYVRGQMQTYLNDLISLGVAGFRVDAARHMAATDLEIIFNGINNLNTLFGFNANSRPFIYQEVQDFGNEPISRDEYTTFGCVCEFRHGINIGEVFQGLNDQKLQYLNNWGTEWSLLDSASAVLFVENHDTQRVEDDNRILTYKKPKQYKMAVAFMQAHPYGVNTKILSGFQFDLYDQGPPSSNEELIGPGIASDGSCTNGWSCEHRWREIANMVEFRNAVEGAEIENWWDNGDQQIAFSRGNKGFIAFTNGGSINTDIKTGLPDGTYCNVISGDVTNGQCTGKTMTVYNGTVHVDLGDNEDDGVVAIHINAKL